MPYAGLSGGIRVVSIYAEALHKRGHDVLVVSTPQAPPGLRARIRKVLSGGLRAGRAGKASYFDGLEVPHKVLERFRPVEDGDVPDADVVIATWWETVEWVSALSPAKGAKAHLVQDHEIFPGIPRERAEAAYRQPYPKIAVSGWLASMLRDVYRSADVSLVPNAVDHTQFRAEPRNKQDVLTIGYMFSPAVRKNAPLAISVLKAARERFPGLRVVCFGAGLPPEVLGFPDWVEIQVRPPQDLLPQLYASCDLWLFTSHSEGFGLPILEAMACRTPVLATPAGAAPDVIEDGVNGFVAEPTVTAFMERIEALDAMSAGTWEAMSAAAQDTARRYTWEGAADKFEEALNAITAAAADRN